MDSLQEIQRFIEAQRQLGARLRSERQLALAIGAPTVIQNWRYGRNRPRPETAESLAIVMQNAGWFKADGSAERFVNGLLRMRSGRRAGACQATCSRAR